MNSGHMVKSTSRIYRLRLKGYNFYTHYLLLGCCTATTPTFLQRMLPEITTGERWDVKP